MRTTLTSDGFGQAAAAQPIVLQLQLSSLIAAPVLPIQKSQAITGVVRSSIKRAQDLHKRHPQATAHGGVGVETARTSAQVRATDLIAELQAINSQVERMMAQVERAVASFALAG